MLQSTWPLQSRAARGAEPGRLGRQQASRSRRNALRDVWPTHDKTFGQRDPLRFIWISIATVLQLCIAAMNRWVMGLMMRSVEHIRKRFPAFRVCADVLLDNAGGSQVPRQVADAMADYMLATYVQLGADYRTSVCSTGTVQKAHEFVNLMMIGVQHGHVALGSSTTVLCAMLAECYARAGSQARNEIIVAETAHESNAGPWFRLADRGFKVHRWLIEADELELPLGSLKRLFSDCTRLVAFPHVFNLLGRIEDSRSITALAHATGARVVIDGVAFGPHRVMEHVWECGRRLVGEGTAETTAWVKALENLLWDGNVREILRRMEIQHAAARSPTEGEASQELITYLTKRDDRRAIDETLGNRSINVAAIR